MFGKKKLPQKDEINLRLFRKLQFSDAWDGESVCSEGRTITLIVYNGANVLWRSVIRSGGSAEHRDFVPPKDSPLERFWSHMYDVATLYMGILHDARDRYHGLATGRDIPEQSWFIPEHLKETMVAHPQYQDLSHDFGACLVPIGTKEHTWKVEIPLIIH